MSKQQKGVKHGAKEAIEKVRSHEHAQIFKSHTEE
jgi:hypothetical protein